MNGTPNRILIAYDGSDCARRALELAASLARNGAVVTVATVCERFSFGLPEPFAAEDQNRLLEEGRELLGARGVRADTINPLDSNAADGLVWAAKELGADVIVMGTHSHGLLARVALGSVARGVVQHAPCSVLVVP